MPDLAPLDYGIERLRRNPGRAGKVLLDLLRGLWARIRYFPRLAGGAGLRVSGGFRIVGPGRVRLGRYVFVSGDLFGPVVFLTTNENAEIVVGENASFGGTKIQCADRIEIGPDCAIANAYLTDTASHALAADRRRNPDAPVAGAPVSIGENVWISSGVTVLHGSVIGANSVIGAMSLVRGAVPPNVFAAGNPLRVLREIPPSSR